MTDEQDRRDDTANLRDVAADNRDHAANARDTTIAGVEEETNSTLDKVIDLVKSLRWAVVIIAVLLLGSLIRSYAVEDAADNAADAADEATDAAELNVEITTEGRDAAQDTLAELRAVVSDLQAAQEAEPDLQNQAIIDALAAVARIEGYLCGGVCPPPEGE